ncbi:Oxidoreductase domain protein [Magnetospirillum sp. LM-5]|uniref:Gfo/Idh/MocA family oxidoreductase n=1 Tax=Magnetospirillum sp. LM-5 TaxID=2681466 RepID=UPI00138478D5|nr:Gfo/Idh/MocA family oxidoreductase [Magnetospirillum sp. LM-5]CAA7618750.1 Oxidoreductase domain protein [Magnetospirillum sp. LM-5]
MPDFADTGKQVAVVGCGYWGRNLVRNFAQLGALAAVCDANRTAAAAKGAEFGVPALTFAEILANPSITGIIIATPAETHAALVREALSADKHVFVEKPLALDVEAAARLCELAEERGLILMVGHLMRYHPAFRALQGLCDSGQLGRIQYIYSHRLNLGKIRTEENSLWSFAPHDISMILALMGGKVSEVEAVGHCYLHRTIADVTTTHITFENGQAAHVFVSWLNPFKEQRLVVVGDRGMAVLEDTLPWASKLRLYPHQVEWQNGIPEASKAEAVELPVEPGEPLALECGHFLECIAGSKQPLTDGREGLAVLRVLDFAQKSMESGKRIVVTAPSPPSEAKAYFSHETAVVDQPCTIGAGTKIWHFSHVLKGSTIGQGCNVGQNVVIGPDVTIGDRCKIQNNVSVYTGVTLEDGVFCGPSMVFTNVMNPRAEIERKHEYRPTLVKRGASIGANATIVCGHTVGRHAFVGAGAVVTRDVSDFAVVAGNPARRIGWICRCGERLPGGDDWTHAVCPSCDTHYRQERGIVEEIAL